MTAARFKRTKPAPPRPPLEPPPPHGLVVTPLEVAGESLVVFSFPRAPSGKRQALTPAEKDVVRHLIEGRSNAEIARTRGRSASTVANQVASIFRKLGVSSRLELARRW